MIKWDPHTIVKTHMCYVKEHNTHANQPYNKMDAKTITKHCQAEFMANVEFTRFWMQENHGSFQFAGFFYVAKKNNLRKFMTPHTKL